MGTHNFEGALHAFEEALKLRRDSWKIWQNLREAALRLGRWSAVLNATGELLGLREKEVPPPPLPVLSGHVSSLPPY